MSRLPFVTGPLRRAIARARAGGGWIFNWRLMLALLVNLLIWYGLLRFIAGR